MPAGPTPKTLKMQGAEPIFNWELGRAGALAPSSHTAPLVRCDGAQTASRMLSSPLPIVCVDSRQLVTPEQRLAAAARGAVVVLAVPAPCALPRAALPAPPAMQRWQRAHDEVCA